MTLAAILSQACTAVSCAASKPLALAELARMAAALGFDATAVARAVGLRESLGSTGIGGGFALPHARMDGVRRPVGFFLRLERPIYWAAIDGRKVDLVLMMLSPRDADADHLATLAAVARRLREPATAMAIRGAAPPHLWQAVVGKDGNGTA